MKRLLLIIGMIVCCGFLSAQKTVYVSEATGYDTWSGIAKQPFASIHKALQTGNVTEIRVAVGVYKISEKLKGQLVIPAGVTVRGGYLLNPDGTVQDEQSGRPDMKSGQTILLGDSTCRIASVAGVLEQVVAAGGKVLGSNGGGVYIESNGLVDRCIIHSNRAFGKMPKVGNLLMKNGEFLDPSLFTYDLKDKVEGIIFWVNPAKEVVTGEQGKALAVKFISDYWMIHKNADANGTISSIGLADPPDLSAMAKPTEGLALTDVDGAVNTDLILGLVEPEYRYPLATGCRALGNAWYMPAMGEVVQMLAEWSAVDDTLYKLWKVICDKAPAELPAYFGTQAGMTKWYESDVLWHGKISLGASSTCKSDTQVWGVGTFTNDVTLQGNNVYNTPGKLYVFARFGIYPVRRF